MLASFTIYGLFVSKPEKKDMYYDSSTTVIEDIVVKGNVVSVDFTYKTIYKLRENGKVGTRMEIRGTLTSQENRDVTEFINENWMAKHLLPKAFAQMAIDEINNRGKSTTILISYALEIAPPLKLSTRLVEAAGAPNPSDKARQ